MRVLDVEVVVSEPPDVEEPKQGQELLELRAVPFRVLLEDLARASGNVRLQRELRERVNVLLVRVLYEMDRGGYDD